MTNIIWDSSKSRISSCGIRGKFCRSLEKGRWWDSARVTRNQWKPGAGQIVEEFENKAICFFFVLRACLKVNRSP